MVLTQKGSALGIKTWAWQFTHGKDEPLPGETPYANEGLLISSVKEILEAGIKKAGRSPKVLVIGAVSLYPGDVIAIDTNMIQLGRCGSGAVQFAKDVGIPDEDIIKWDLEETKKGISLSRANAFLILTSTGGPFKEIVEDADIFINCIYLSTPIPPFVNAETLASSKRTLSVVCDVSADTYVLAPSSISL